ncbi:MAG: MotA/TolQ/ExbB proton channel family protein [Proteobacteria bacterium]|nr:MotA/TolQ/ExbB proton channel family protein [Pseudomonadota bacterium]
MDNVICPRCGHPNPAPVHQRIVDCARCDRSFAQRSPDAPPSASGADPPRIAVHTERVAPTDVSLPLAALIAAGVTILFYAIVVAPFRETYFGELFADRGWVPYAIAWLSAWAFVVLTLKYRRLALEVKALEIDLLPDTIAERITPENVHAFAGYVRHLSAAVPGRFVLGRVQRAVQHFRARPRVQEVIDQLGNQAQADANAVDASYTMLRVFIWAIPILGFIGTVIGIGTAVGAFSDSVNAAVDLDVMKQSIGAVTTGLGVAFDTTLLALVMSIFIMFPASSLQKAEEDFLARLESYCDVRLLRRLDDGTAAVESEGSLRDVLTRLSGTLSQIERRLALAPAPPA